MIQMDQNQRQGTPNLKKHQSQKQTTTMMMRRLLHLLVRGLHLQDFR